MPLRIKPLSLLFLMLIVCSSSLVKGSIQHEGAKMHESFMLYKSEEMEVKILSHRKLMFHSTTDYDDAGANPKHDPRRRPGGKP
ncbi:Transmembrane protein [Hirschfeldia incana]|nr:Transmembrane protein [Hirschfeldia incana]